jgi:GTPase SAR1 family protein
VQESMRKIVSMYIKKSDGVMVIFDLTERQTFESVEYWMTSIDQPGAKTEKVQKILVGNKSDSASGQRLVSTEEGLALAKKFNVPYIETSAKDNLGITEVRLCFHDAVALRVHTLCAISSIRLLALILCIVVRWDGAMSRDSNRW